MTSSTIDHLVSVTVLLAVVLLFTSLFNQTLQTAVLYQRNRNLAIKGSDLLDNILLNPGVPSDWGRRNVVPTGFGLQDPEFTRYSLNPFSLMRLQSSSGTPVYYPKTGETYSNTTMGFGNFLLVPYSEAVNYSTVAKLLGIKDHYGFQLSLTPMITISISEVQSNSPLRLVLNVRGPGSPISNAAVTYAFLTVSLTGGGSFPSYKVEYGKTVADETGSVTLEFNEITSDDVVYALMAYARISGLVGVGYHQRMTSTQQYIIPFVDDFELRRVIIAHSYDVHYLGPPVGALTYNATFVLLTEDFTLREMPMENSTGKVGMVVYGEGKPYGVVTIPTYNPGILVIPFRKSAVEGGIILMPWGISSMGFSVTIGDDPFGKEWVATDIRQVLVNGVSYQAKFAFWSLEGYQVIK